MPDQSPRILVVEDDESLRDALRSWLRSQHYEVRCEEDGTDIRRVATAFQPDLAVLDIRLPIGPSGLSIARVVRELFPDLPLLFLSAAGSERDRLAGFEAGADDYVVKPYSMSELSARINALLRRSGRLTSDIWQVGDLTMDAASRTVRRGDVVLDLTKTEFDLLTALGKNTGRILNKTQLLLAVWGFDAHDQNLVEVHMSALRRKLEAEGPRVIHTVRGAGYVLRPA